MIYVENSCSEDDETNETAKKRIECEFECNLCCCVTHVKCHGLLKPVVLSSCVADDAPFEPQLNSCAHIQKEPAPHEQHSVCYKDTLRVINLIRLIV